MILTQVHIGQDLSKNLGTEYHFRPKKLQGLANLSKHPVGFTLWASWMPILNHLMTYPAGKTLPQAMFQAEGSGLVMVSKMLAVLSHIPEVT